MDFCFDTYEIGIDARKYGLCKRKHRREYGTETTKVRVRWWAYKQNGAAATDSGTIDEAMASMMDAAAGSENG
jgi:hypothetical protein